jgi:hypothetical protein
MKESISWKKEKPEHIKTIKEFKTARLYIWWHKEHIHVNCRPYKEGAAPRLMTCQEIDVENSCNPNPSTSFHQKMALQQGKVREYVTFVCILHTQLKSRF